MLLPLGPPEDTITPSAVQPPTCNKVPQVTSVISYLCTLYSRTPVAYQLWQMYTAFQRMSQTSNNSIRTWFSRTIWNRTRTEKSDCLETVPEQQPPQHSWRLFVKGLPNTPHPPPAHHPPHTYSCWWQNDQGADDCGHSTEDGNVRSALPDRMFNSLCIKIAQ